MGTTKIEWTESTWNPVSGCTKVSPGCANCYAERMAKRLKAMGTPGYEDGFAVTLHPNRLADPLRWKKPRMIFVGSMGDLFHEDVPDEFIWQVIETAYQAKQHVFQILTKRPERMRDVLTRSAWWNNDTPPNIWLGTSTENQETANERIPHLLDCPAAVRFVSAEPLLGPVNLAEYLSCDCVAAGRAGWEPGPVQQRELCQACGGFPFRDSIDWVIVGGESGPGARPMKPDWVRSIRDECQAAGVSFFMKQMGGYPSKRAAIRDIPTDLQIREMPVAADATGA